MITEEEIEHHHDLCEQAKSLIAIGEWTHENNRRSWVAFGLNCLMVRASTTLSWCGYVGLKPWHPFYFKTEEEISDAIQVHGGVTYFHECSGVICHPFDEGSKPTKWVGFDCAHFMDVSPRFDAKGDPGTGTYKNETWVKLEVENLAQQVAVFSK